MSGKSIAASDRYSRLHGVDTDAAYVRSSRKSEPMPYKPKTFRPPHADKARKDHAKRYERTAERKADHAFYDSARWIRLRNWHRARFPLCAECERNGIVRAMAHVDHIIDRKERPDLAFDASNLESLCIECHSRKTHGARR